MLCDDLNGKEIQKRGDICICIADSLCCTVETNGCESWHIFSILEDYGLDPNHIPENPHNIYFGRWIADEHRELIESYSVKKRHYLKYKHGCWFIIHHGQPWKSEKKGYCI